jgi:ABC-type multidrug transport system fused ATPase/permease subunit
MTYRMTHNIWSARDFVSVFFFFLLVYAIINWCMRHRWWVLIDIPLRKWIQHYALKTFLTIEPTHIEKFGTGKVQSILSKWIDRRYEMLAGIAYEVAPLAIFMFYSIWSLWAIDPRLSLGFLIIVIITVYLNLWLNSKAMKYINDWKTAYSMVCAGLTV